MDIDNKIRWEIGTSAKTWRKVPVCITEDTGEFKYNKLYAKYNSCLNDCIKLNKTK